MAVYAAGPHSRVTGPDTWVPGWIPAEIAARLAPLVAQTAAALVTEAAARFPWEPMATAFEAVAEVGPGARVVAGVGSSDPILPLINYDVRAHWPPWQTGTRFAAWAERHGIPAYLAARSYARHDHPGSRAMEQVQAAAGAAFAADLEAGLTGLLDP